MALHSHARHEPVRYDPNPGGDIRVDKTKLATGYYYPGRACLINVTDWLAQRR